MKDFVPHEESLALKELGFDEPCFSSYTHEGKFSNEISFNEYKNTALKTSAPTYSQAFRWFRDNHNLQHEITRQGTNYWLLGIIETDDVTEHGIFKGKNFNLEDFQDFKEPESYEHAELICLRKLIQLVRNEKQK